MELNTLNQADIEFDRLVSDKRHKEIIGALKTLISEFQKPQDNSVKEAIHNQLKVLESLVKVLTSTPPPAPPVVNVHSDPSELVNAIKNLPIPSSAAPAEHHKEWEFNVLRNRGGLIESITAKAK